MAELSMREDQESGKLVCESRMLYPIWAISVFIIIPAVLTVGKLFGIFPSRAEDPLGVFYTCVFSMAVLLVWFVTHPKTQLIFDSKHQVLTKTDRLAFGQRPTTVTVLPFKEMAALRVVITKGGYYLIVTNTKGKEIRLNSGVDREEMFEFAQKVSSMTGVSVKNASYRLWPP